MAAHIAADAGYGEVVGMNQPAAALASGGKGRDLYAVVDLHMAATGLDSPAIAGFRRAGVQRARDARGAAIDAAE
ncbi:hypothetical protein D3C87_2115700 [compost metagenome]